MTIFPLILCGGSGTRLWPASTPARPKQFLPLLGARSMFQETVLRCAPLGPRVAVVAGEAHLPLIRGQLSEIGIEAAILIEPEARDSGPAVAAAAAWIVTQQADGLGLMVASDHYVGDEEAFRRSVRIAAGAAEQGRIVTFGVRPTEPSEAYGYILPAGPAADVRPVGRFVEKPEAEVAARYLAEGYLWNSGNFVFAAAVLLSELDRHSPEMAAAAREAVAGASVEHEVLRLGPAFHRAPKLSVDYAVMERTDRASVTAVSFPWSDLGAWDAVWAASARDEHGNATPAGTVFDRAEGNLVRVPHGTRVALAGVRDLVVVAERDALLICDRHSSQAVKALGALAASTRPSPEALSVLAARLDRWLDAAALPLWWSLGADHVEGGFHEALDGDGRAVTAPRRARVQARQLWTYAQAAEDGWPGPAAQGARHALDGFKRRYLRDDGLFATLPGSALATVYDQAFALFALSAAEPLFGEEAQQLAAGVLVGLEARRHSAGGFVEDADRAFQSNPHMHVLEAALAWEARAPADPRWRALADEAAGLALTRFIDFETGALREFFDADWRAVDGRVEPGHQFEWAWLLRLWGERRDRPDALEAAHRLYAVGDQGVDEGRGVAVDALDGELRVLEPTARLWPQTERLRAALSLGHPDHAAEAATTLLRYLDTPVRGLWRDRMRKDGAFVEEPAPASSLYHLAGAVRALRAKL